MGRWHSIAQKKASGDLKKSQNYARIGRVIEIAARKGADSSMNPSLELALQKAKQYGLPKDVVEKAIKKGSGQLEGVTTEEIVYEAFGPEGVSLVIKIFTDNNNRTSANIKTTLGKAGGSLGKPGSVAWNFNEDGVFVIDGIVEKKLDKGNMIDIIHPLDKEAAELAFMELPIEDVEFEDGQAILYTTKEHFNTVQHSLYELKYHVVDAGIHFIPKDMLVLSDVAKERFMHLLDYLDEDDDVQEVYHNVEL